MCPTRPNSCVDALLLFLNKFITRVNHKTKHGGTLIESSIYNCITSEVLCLRTLRGSNFPQIYRPYLVVFSWSQLRDGSGVRTNSKFLDHKSACTFCTLEPQKPLSKMLFFAATKQENQDAHLSELVNIGRDSTKLVLGNSKSSSELHATLFFQTIQIS